MLPGSQHGGNFRFLFLFCFKSFFSSKFQFFLLISIYFFFHFSSENLEFYQDDMIIFIRAD